MKISEQKTAAEKFYKDWVGHGDEKSETQKFWNALLVDVLEVDDVWHFIDYEKKVKLGNVSFIDGYIESTKVLIEQKSMDVSLEKASKQSDGSFLTPFEQGKRYSDDLPYSEKPRWIVTCNFQEFRIHDMEKPKEEPLIIKLEELPDTIHLLNFLAERTDSELKKEIEVSVKAGELVGKLYDALLNNYISPENEETLKSLNVLCVRLVFCLYAEDAGLFGSVNAFHDYLKPYSTGGDLREALIKLFQVLNIPEEKRDPYLKKELAAFPYTNGGLFDTEIEIPTFDENVKSILLEEMSGGFDWRKISPTIFGAVFESTLNPENRHSGGMHYTSITNIHKVIDPLFLDELKKELKAIKLIAVDKKRNTKLKAFQDKLSNLTFLDPAAGSGNFLTETYLSLRKLENEVVEALSGGQVLLAQDSLQPIKVKIDQFYGIEINDFAVSVAKTALWIAEAQMMEATAKLIHQNLDFLPLKSFTNVHEGNALRMDWGEIISPMRLNYIMGNPPFLGARVMSEEQKSDIVKNFGEIKGVGNLDYVSAWYIKAANLMSGKNIRAAFVSTNSISQGEQPAILWKELFSKNMKIDFAYKPFIWQNEAKNKAHVHCVIIGFSSASVSAGKKKIFNKDVIIADNINPYIVNAPNVLVESRNKPICSIPEMGIGNKPIDGGNYLFTKEEMDRFIEKEPKSEKWFRPWIGSKEFINGYERYCLWLGECTPSELKEMPEAMKRIQAVRELRLASKSKPTNMIADKPTRFHVENMPTKTYMIVPKVSTSRRRYVPIGFVEPNVLSSDLVQIVENATLYHFGIITSNVHNSWMRYVAGRLGMGYRYSRDVVYNNFPWPLSTNEQKTKIEQTAQGILDARKLYPDSSLADLYDPLTMPPELQKAHKENDRAVMQAYGFPIKGTTEESCVAELMKLYQKRIKEIEGK